MSYQEARDVAQAVDGVVNDELRSIVQEHIKDNMLSPVALLDVSGELNTIDQIVTEEIDSQCGVMNNYDFSEVINAHFNEFRENLDGFMPLIYECLEADIQDERDTNLLDALESGDCPFEYGDLERADFDWPKSEIDAIVMDIDPDPETAARIYIFAEKQINEDGWHDPEITQEFVMIFDLKPVYVFGSVLSGFAVAVNSELTGPRILRTLDIVFHVGKPEFLATMQETVRKYFTLSDELFASAWPTLTEFRNRDIPF